MCCYLRWITSTGYLNGIALKLCRQSLVVFNYICSVTPKVSSLQKCAGKENEKRKKQIAEEKQKIVSCYWKIISSFFKAAQTTKLINQQCRINNKHNSIYSALTFVTPLLNRRFQEWKVEYFTTEFCTIIQLWGTFCHPSEKTLTSL